MPNPKDASADRTRGRGTRHRNFVDRIQSRGRGAQSQLRVGRRTERASPGGGIYLRALFSRRRRWNEAACRYPVLRDQLRNALLDRGAPQLLDQAQLLLVRTSVRSQILLTRSYRPVLQLVCRSISSFTFLDMDFIIMEAVGIATTTVPMDNFIGNCSGNSCNSCIH